MPRDGGAGWLVSRRTRGRAVWSGLGVVVFGAATIATLVGFVRAPHVDSGVLVLIALPFLVMAVVLALEALGQGLVHVDGAGYRTLLGARRAWGDVLALGVGEVDGRTMPVVALADAAGAFPLTQESFPGFAEEEAPRLVAAFAAHCGRGAGFGGVTVPQGWWDDAEAEASRVEAVVTEGCGRAPQGRDRVAFGYPGVPSAVRLDYGTNAVGDRVEVLCRRSSDLALTRAGRRWLRQNRKRSADPATQVCLLFGDYTVEETPNRGAGFDRIGVVSASGGRLPFNAEEPDRFAGQGMPA